MTDQWSLIELFNLGGPFMWPLLAFSVASLSIIVERTIYLFWHDLRVTAMKSRAAELAGAKQFAEAEDYLKGFTRRSPAAAVLLEVVRHRDFGERRMEKSAEAEAQEKLRRLEHGFNYLTALASIAPLTGFLGTVSGMIGAFKSIAGATEVNAQLVANGIYEALITTVFGLCIAIVTLIAYNLMSQRVDSFAADISKGVNDLVSEIVRGEGEE